MKQLTIEDLGETLPCECGNVTTCMCQRPTVSIPDLVQRGVLEPNEDFTWPRPFNQSNRRRILTVPGNLIIGNPQRVTVRVCTSCRYDHLGSF